MNKWILIGLVAFVVLLVLAFVSPFPDRREPLPLYPKTVNKQGQYWIDDSRYVLLKSDDRGLLYSEVTQDPPEKKAGGTVIETYSYESGGELLPPDCALGLEAPDTIVIELGKGEVIRRKFGDEQIKPGKAVVKVMKTPSSPDGIMNQDEVRSIPMDEVEAPSLEEE